MRREISINRDWRLLVNPPADSGAKSKSGMYLSAKTERLKWGPGAYSHNDSTDFWSLTEEIPSENWEAVDLPHDYIISQRPERGESGALGYFKYPCAWYRKHFSVSPEDCGKRISVFFEGVTGISDVYLNGCFLKHNSGGYVSFEVDLTDLVRFDRENVLAVRIDPNSYEGWWYAGGGIYRNVRLCVTDFVSVDLWGVFVPVERLEGDRWNIPAEVTLRNIGYTDSSVKVLCEVVSPDGRSAGKFSMYGVVPARGTTKLCGGTELLSPQLWDLETPHRYTLKVRVEKKMEGEFVPCDEYDQKFGFREIVLSPEKGLFLNGVNIKLKGVCAHLDFGLTGKAVPDNICRKKIALFKEMGANAFRTSHYPHQEATMEACDELGLLVMDETRRFESCEEALSQMEMLVLRDRNRPSVFLWSTGNEEIAYHGLPQGHRIHRALEYAIRKLDPTRSVTTAVTNYEDADIQSDCEVIGINYALKHIDLCHAKFPGKPILSSENCAVASTRSWYFGDSAESGRMDARDRDPDPGEMVFGREKTWRFIMERPWLAGGFQWDAVEHRGEAVWPRICSVSGAIDLYFQKKDAFYQNQSLWLDTPVIHLLPHWTHPGMEGLPVRVWVYTNCCEAELVLNGESLGRKKVPALTHVEWLVPYTPGRLEAFGYSDGGQIVSDARETSGMPAALKLKLENPGGFSANGEDIALFTCLAVDDSGRETPDASPLVEFDCTGIGRIVGTGSDNTDHAPVTDLVRRMYAGRISIAVKLGTASGELMLFAKSSALRGACLTVCAQEKSK